MRHPPLALKIEKLVSPVLPFTELKISIKINLIMRRFDLSKHSPFFFVLFWWGTNFSKKLQGCHFSIRRNPQLNLKILKVPTSCHYIASMYPLPFPSPQFSIWSRPNFLNFLSTSQIVGFSKTYRHKISVTIFKGAKILKIFSKFYSTEIIIIGDCFKNIFFAFIIHTCLLRTEVSDSTRKPLLMAFDGRRICIRSRLTRLRWYVALIYCYLFDSLV